MNASVDAFRELGARLVAVSPQLPEKSRDMIDRHRLRFEILQDPGNEVAAQFRVRYVLPEYLRETYLALGIDLGASNGEESWSLPLPARYVIDTDRVVRGASVNPDYRFRPEPDDAVAILRQLRS